MSPQDSAAPSPKSAATGASAKRHYIPPALETLGTIDDLTHGLGMDGARDTEHPPGQNKSIGP
jgi:hypothetical protein